MGAPLFVCDDGEDRVCNSVMIFVQYAQPAASPCNTSDFCLRQAQVKSYLQPVANGYRRRQRLASCRYSFRSGRGAHPGPRASAGSAPLRRAASCQVKSAGGMRGGAANPGKGGASRVCRRPRKRRTAIRGRAGTPGATARLGRSACLALLWPPRCRRRPWRRRPVRALPGQPLDGAWS